MRAKRPGVNEAVLVGEDGAGADGAGLRVELVVDEVDVALVGKPVLVGEAEVHRASAPSRSSAPRAVARQLVVLEVGLLVALEVDVDRVERDDGGEQRGRRGPGLHQVAGGHLGAARRGR